VKFPGGTAEGRHRQLDDVRERRVLIVEGNPDGHRLAYVSLLAAAAKARGEKAIIATSNIALNSAEWGIHMGNSTGLEISIVDDFTLASLARQANDLAVDHVVIPDGDQFAYKLARGKKWAAQGTVTVLVMREKGQSLQLPFIASTITLLKRVLLLAANRRSRVQVRVLKSATWRGSSLLPVSRDPVSLEFSHEDARPENLPALVDSYFWFGVVGKVGQRKNLPLVASSLAALQRSDIALLVAGEVEPGILEQADYYFERIRELGGQVEIVDRLLSDEEIDRVIRDLDCVVLAHSNEGPSGILGKAVMAGTRIVTAGALSLRHDCNHIGIGAHWAKLKEEGITSALARAMKTSPPASNRVASPDEFTSSLLGPKK
jgi:glycosyltransferase involved in cell wall biosynthesis